MRRVIVGSSISDPVLNYQHRLNLIQQCDILSSWGTYGYSSWYFKVVLRPDTDTGPCGPRTEKGGFSVCCGRKWSWKILLASNDCDGRSTFNGKCLPLWLHSFHSFSFNSQDNPTGIR